jgi:hypothetical protein
MDGVLGGRHACRVDGSGGGAARDQPGWWMV